MTGRLPVPGFLVALVLFVGGLVLLGSGASGGNPFFAEELLALGPAREVPSTVRDLLLAGWVALMGRLAWRVLEWREDWFVVTDRRLLLRTGLVTRRVAMMPLLKVTDMSYARPPAGRVLGYGEIVIESAGRDQALRRQVMRGADAALHRLPRGLVAGIVEDGHLDPRDRTVLVQPQAFDPAVDLAAMAAVEADQRQDAVADPFHGGGVGRFNRPACQHAIGPSLSHTRRAHRPAA